MSGLFGSFSLRLAAVYTAAFALSVIALGVVTVLTTRGALGRQFDDRIRTESASLAEEYRTEGLMGVLQAVRERDQTPGALDYGLQARGGVALAGRLGGLSAPPGWSSVTAREGSHEAERTRLLVTALPGGVRLLVGDDAERNEALDGVLVRSFALAFLGVVLLGMAGGYGLSRDVHRRLASITSTAQAIIGGDMSRRAPTRGGGDDLDRLAATLNLMLDRIATLMDSVRQVSTDIAHDLRTPLTRLRGRLEAALAEPDRTTLVSTLDSALAELDSILGVFAALLRISQIEAGARRAAFRSVDLAVIAHTVVEAFAPSAEDIGASLEVETDRPLIIEGDPELLTQMLVNLVENALRHAGASPKVVVRGRRGPQGPVLSVLDNGPGAPASERERLFDRFHRLETSRSTPGSGLGLALVRAVARLHGAEASLHDASPGLEARIVFSTRAEP